MPMAKAQMMPAKAVLAAMHRGDLLAAYDIAERALREAPDDLELKYLSVLALARSGATELASKQFERLGLGKAGAHSHLAIDIPALAARLAKDRALNASSPSGPGFSSMPRTPMRRCSRQAMMPIQVSMRRRWRFGLESGTGPQPWHPTPWLPCRRSRKARDPTGPWRPKGAAPSARR
jgi:hypothetical protein